MSATTPCVQHDWRIDPHLVLTSYPPRSRIVCASCGATSLTDPVYRVHFMSDDPRDWEPYGPRNLSQ